jgi:hypothetical protein
MATEFDCIPERYRDAVNNILRDCNDCHEYDQEQEQCIWMIDRLEDYDLYPSVSVLWFDDMMRLADTIAFNRLCRE